MKQLFLFFIGFFIHSIVSWSQSSIPEYGVVTNEEENLTACAFDKEAEAAILFDKAVAGYDGYERLITLRRIRIKILKESGIGRGDIVIPFYSKDKFEYISNVRGYVFNPGTKNGSRGITPLQASSIYIEKANELYSQVKFAVPDVKVGSIIEYEFQSEMENYSGLRSWSFQSDLPTYISYFNVTMLPKISFAWNLQMDPSFKIDIQTPVKGTISFEIKNIPALRNEPYADALDDFRQKVFFQQSEYRTQDGFIRKLANTWEQLGTDLLRSAEFIGATDRVPSDAKAFVEQVKLKTDPLERVKMIFDYVRNNMEWNHIYSISAPYGVKNTWNKKNGSSGEINLLLLNLLKGAEIEADPLLVSERHHGKVITEYPFIDQFNKVVAYVNLGGRNYILDATDVQTPMNVIPFSLINTIGFLVKKKNFKHLVLSDSTYKISDKMWVNSEISEDGIITGELNEKSRDYSKYNRLDYFKKHDANVFFDKYYKKKVSDLTFDSLRLENQELDTISLGQSFLFKTSMLQSGNYWVVDLNLFSDLATSPFISDIRFTTINFGVPVEKTQQWKLKIPASMVPDVLPKNINLTMSDGSIQLLRTLRYEPETHTVIQDVTYKLNDHFFTNKEYPFIKSFFGKMVNLMNEPLLLKKK